MSQATKAITSNTSPTSSQPRFPLTLELYARQLDELEERMLIHWKARGKVPVGLLEIWVEQTMDAMARGRKIEVMPLLHKAKEGICGKYGAIVDDSKGSLRSRLDKLGKSIASLTGDNAPQNNFERGISVSNSTIPFRRMTAFYSPTASRNPRGRRKASNLGD